MEGLKKRIIKKVNDGSIVSTEELIKFFNSHNEIKINWQDKNKKRLYDAILDAYMENLNKQDLYLCLRQTDIYKNICSSLLTVAELNQDFTMKTLNNKHNKNIDVIMLPQFENSNFIYFIPCSIKAFVWLNHFSCGFQPAKWCLGWEFVETSPQPFPLATEHCETEFYIVGIHKDQLKVQDKNSTKVLIEYSGATTIAYGYNASRQFCALYKVDPNIKNGFPPQVYSATNKFIQFSESDKIAQELSKYVYACWKNKDKIPSYTFNGWTEDTFKYFTTFAKESALGIPSYKSE